MQAKLHAGNHFCSSSGSGLRPRMSQKDFSLLKCSLGLLDPKKCIPSPSPLWQGTTLPLRLPDSVFPCFVPSGMCFAHSWPSPQKIQ